MGVAPKTPMWSEVKVIQSGLTLCDPMNYTAYEILQARILEWVTFPFSRGSSQPRDWTQVSHIAGGFFTRWATREAQEYWSGKPIPFSRGSSRPRNQTRVPCIAGRFFTNWAIRDALNWKLSCWESLLWAVGSHWISEITRNHICSSDRSGASGTPSSVGGGSSDGCNYTAQGFTKSSVSRGEEAQNVEIVC